MSRDARSLAWSSSRCSLLSHIFALHHEDISDEEEENTDEEEEVFACYKGTMQFYVSVVARFRSVVSPSLHPPMEEDGENQVLKQGHIVLSGSLEVTMKLKEVTFHNCYIVDGLKFRGFGHC